MSGPVLDGSTTRFERMILLPRAVLGVGLLVVPPAVTDLPGPVMVVAGLALIGGLGRRGAAAAPR